MTSRSTCPPSWRSRTSDLADWEIAHGRLGVSRCGAGARAPVVLQERAHPGDGVADGASAHVEQFGQHVADFSGVGGVEGQDVVA
jgi:hypothetical protein